MGPRLHEALDFLYCTTHSSLYYTVCALPTGVLVVTVLGAAPLIAGMYFGTKLGEKLSRRDIFALFLIILGTTFVDAALAQRENVVVTAVQCSVLPCTSLSCPTLHSPAPYVAMCWTVVHCPARLILRLPTPHRATPPYG
jgi:hypothetical protein